MRTKRWICIAAACAFAAAAADAPEDLRFSEMFVSPVGPAGLVATPKLRSLAGRPVRVTGYVVRRGDAPPGTLIITPLPVTLGDEDEGLADDLPATAVTIHLAPPDDAVAVPPASGLVRVTGTLQLGPAREADGRLSTLRLLLDDDASRALLQSLRNSHDKATR